MIEETLSEFSVREFAEKQPRMAGWSEHLAAAPLQHHAERDEYGCGWASLG